MSPRSLSATVWTSPQLSPDVMPQLAEAGIGRIVSNRPDGEDPGQPSAAEMEAVARAAGMDFAWVPVSGLPAPDQVAKVAELLADGTPTVMFCRSGMRSAAIPRCPNLRPRIRRDLIVEGLTTIKGNGIARFNLKPRRE